jgi:[ribosomal protein S18]-alanine N-acetyltransferase
MIPHLFNATENDAALLASLHASAFALPWTEAAICELLAGPGVFVFFTRDGFVMGRAAGGEAEILTLAVKPEARGKGLGRALIVAMAVHAHKLGAGSIFLEVGDDNPAALALYAGLGFARVGQRKGYYAGADASVLKAALPLSLAQKFA